MLVATLVLWALLRGLFGRPVVMLTGVMKRLAGGENLLDVPEADRGDELGDMARAVLVFRDAAIAKEAADRAKAIADAEQKLVVGTLADGLGKLSQGDLTAEIGAGFPENYAVVKTNFNDALCALRTLIGAVREGAEAIQSGSGEIATASEGVGTFDAGEMHLGHQPVVAAEAQAGVRRCRDAGNCRARRRSATCRSSSTPCATCG